MEDANAGENVVTLIEEACRRHGSRTALVEVDDDAAELRSVTYAQLFDVVERLIDGLAARGLQAGDRVAVLLDNSIEMVATEWACLLSGFVWVALNARSSPAELAEILHDCDPAVVISDQDHAATLREGDPACVPLCVGGDTWREMLGAVPSASHPPRPDADTPVRIRYTSGTAGRAKGAVLARRSYDASVAAVTDVIAPLEVGDVVVHVAPMTHASGAMWLPHARVGARAVLMKRFDVAGLIRVCSRYRATALFLVPTMFVRLLDAVADRSALSSLRTIVYGGASMSAERLAAAVERFGPMFVQIYGLTESTWPICALRRDDHLRRDAESREQWLARLRSCGRPTSVGEIRLIAPDGSDVSDGQLGELLVRGNNTMTGYWRRSAQSATAASEPKGLDADGWMHTGDVGLRDSEGFVTIVDRLHDMIVSGGFNVYPREVEDALATHPAVLESAVVGLAHEQWGEAVHACVVLRDAMRADARELIDHCARRVARFKLPKSVEFLDALPKNAAGKVLRRRLRDQRKTGGTR